MNLLCISTILFSLTAAILCDENKFKTSYELNIKDDEQRTQLLTQLYEPSDGVHHDILYFPVTSAPAEHGNAAVVRVARDQEKSFLRTMRRLKVAVNKLNADNEIPSSNNNWRSRRGLHDHFMRFQEMMDFMYDVASEHSFATVETFGTTAEGRPISGLKLSKNPRNTMVYIDAGIHAREWAAVHSMPYVIQQLTSPRGSKYLDRYQFVIIPIVNPDGYEYTHTNNRMWRKNRNPTFKSRCFGVDPNRNFDASWGGKGTSGNPCEDIYRGPNKSSEKEVQAVENALTKYKHVVKMFLTFHAYGQLIILPFGHEKNTYPDNIKTLKEMSKYAVEKIERMSQSSIKYIYGSVSDILYPASGGSMDYAAGTMKIPYTFGFELSPNIRARSNNPPGFVISPRQILPIAKEAWALVTAMLDQMPKYET